MHTTAHPTTLARQPNSPMLRSALLNVMTAAARKAGRSLKRDFGEVEKLQVSFKGPANFVTAADHRAEEILRAELAKARPGYGFLGEEGGLEEGTDKSHRWIVDPLDGTTNFLHGIPQFAISIGLERDKRDGRRPRLQSGERGAVRRRTRQGRVPQRPAAARRQSARGSPTRWSPAACRISAAAISRCSAGNSPRSRSSVAGIAPVRRGRPRSRLGRRRPARRLLGARPVAMGHGRGHGAGARGRRLRRPTSTAATPSSRSVRSSPVTNSSRVR